MTDETISNVPILILGNKIDRTDAISEEKLREMGLSTEGLIEFSDLMSEAFKAGLTAATISMVLRVAPEIYKALSLLILITIRNTERMP